MSHCVWKSLKRWHSTLRAKRATLTFRVDKSSSKMVEFGKFLKNWNLQSNSVTRQVKNKNKNWWKAWKGQNWKIQMRNFSHFIWFRYINSHHSLFLNNVFRFRFDMYLCRCRSKCYSRRQRGILKTNALFWSSWVPSPSFRCSTRVQHWYTHYDGHYCNRFSRDVTWNAICCE